MAGHRKSMYRPNTQSNGFHDLAERYLEWGAGRILQSDIIASVFSLSIFTKMDKGRLQSIPISNAPRIPFLWNVVEVI